MINKQSSSGVSIAIKNTMHSYQNSNPLVEKCKPKEFTIKIANTLEERESVFRLAYQVYLAKGFIKQSPNEWLVQYYDSDPASTILIVEDQEKNLVGSVTLVFDGSKKIPAEKIYSEELKILRKQNEKIAEISRLVIEPQYRNAKEILVLLFNYLYIYAYYVKQFTCLAIEVNPRHTAYYQALLHFREIGCERPCPQVQSAPAKLLYLALKHAQREVVEISQKTEMDKRSRSLYQHFINPEQENLVAYYLNNQAKPMSAEEKQYFGFTESGIRLQFVFD